MANRKASAFEVLSSLVDSTYIALAVTGTNYKATMSAVWSYVQGKIKGSATNLSTGGTLTLANNDYVHALVVTNAGGSPVTFSVGTSAGGTQIVDNEIVAAGATVTFVVNHWNESSANIHFTLDTGSLSVRVVKQ